MRVKGARFFVLALGACSGAGGGASFSHVVETIDGVETVTNRGTGAWAAEERTAWVVSGPRVRLGAVEGDGPEVFGTIGAVAVGPDGTIYVGDATAQEVRAFDAEGGFQRSFGRNGEGPGEFGAIDGIVVEPGGAVLVRDPRIGRVSRFGPDGEYESGFRLERAFFVFSDGTPFWLDDEGLLYDQVPLAVDEGPGGIGLVRYRAGVPQDTLRALRYSLPQVIASRGGQTVLSMIPAYVALPRAAVRRDGAVAAILGDEYRITEMTPTGDVRRVIRRDLLPPPLSEGAREAGLRSMRTRIEDMAPGATLGEVTFPPRVPAYSRLIGDPAGYWWAGRYRGERDADDPSATFPTEYDVFDSDGVFLGAVATPPILIMQVGPDYVAGVETDLLGIQYAVVLDLDRRGAP